MYEAPNYFVITFAELLILLKALTLGWLIGQGVYDPSFFTYFTYTLLYAFYVLAFLSYGSLRGMQFVYTFLLIPMLGIVAFVCFAIIVIVACNDWVLVRTTILGGTTRKIGAVHTGDFVLHYLPLIGFTAYILVHQLYIGMSFDGFWRSLHRGEKVGYLIYLYLAPLAVLWLYMVNMPFDKNYPTKLSEPVVISLTAALSAFLQTIILLIMFFVLRPPIYNRHKLVTPTGKVRRSWNQTSKPSLASITVAQPASWHVLPRSLSSLNRN